MTTHIGAALRVKAAKALHPIIVSVTPSVHVLAASHALALVAFRPILLSGNANEHTKVTETAARQWRGMEMPSVPRLTPRRCTAMRMP
jgi:hypothetical protein